MGTPLAATGNWQSRLTRGQRILLAVLACLVTTAAATPLRLWLDQANIVMLFLLTVLVTAVVLGRGGAVVASVLSVLLFDVFFVPPRFSLTVNNLQYLVTFAVMLTTALVTTQFTAMLKLRGDEALAREQATQSLYALARQLAGSLAFAQVQAAVRHFMAQQLRADAWIILDDDLTGSLTPAFEPPPFRVETYLLRAAMSGGQPVFNPSAAGSGCASVYLPLCAGPRSRGVLAIALAAQAPDLTPAARALLDALASLIAVAVERLHYVEVAQTAQVDMASERLRSSILSALSHDLRTPLTVLVGLADSLSLMKPPLPPAAREAAGALRDQAQRLANLVGNLLDMARLNAGNVVLRREWQPLEDVIGSSIKLLGAALDRHPVSIDLPPELPLLEFDAVLIERVFCNLLENAAKYAPVDTSITIEAELQADRVVIRVGDRGSGFPAERQDELFAMFGRGRSESTQGGVGLGLAICRAIIEAHGGSIGLQYPAVGGCVFFTLPLGTPPQLEAEPA